MSVFTLSFPICPYSNLQLNLVRRRIYESDFLPKERLGLRLFRQSRHHFLTYARPEGLDRKDKSNLCIFSRLLQFNYLKPCMEARLPKIRR